MPNKHYNSIDEVIEEMRGMTTDEVIAMVRAKRGDGPRLITRDMLLAAGALNVKGARKPKGEGPRPLFDSIDDDEGTQDDEESASDENEAK